MKLGLSLQEVGDMVGVSRAHVSGIERGVSRPGPKVLEDLAWALHIPVSELRDLAGIPSFRAREALRKRPVLMSRILEWAEGRRESELHALITPDTGPEIGEEGANPCREPEEGQAAVQDR